jgi:S-adenosylmethionine:tRNA ribosyltransferase-isomerase
MKLSDFDYRISKEHIAQHPLTERDSSKLFVIHRNSDKFEHRNFKDIVSYLNPGDILILNDTKVFPARLFGVKPSGGKVEILLLKELRRNKWEALVKGLREGTVLLNGNIIAHVSGSDGTSARVEFKFNTVGTGLKSANTPDIKTILHKIGVVPLPPYIKRQTISSDTEQYQTVYANKEGAVAAPTAGLHFTKQLLSIIKEKGISVETVTLHVGYGTFKPVIAHDINEHNMDEEFYEIPESTANAINRAKSEGSRVIAAGTTVTRALEAAACNENIHPPLVPSGTGKTSIFIYPGYQFKVIDALITNFHLPKSTPMMLTSAFAGLNILKRSYDEAQNAGYRFFSYGDAMLIL